MAGSSGKGNAQCDALISLLALEFSWVIREISRGELRIVGQICWKHHGDQSGPPKGLPQRAVKTSSVKVQLLSVSRGSALQGGGGDSYIGYIWHFKAGLQLIVNDLAAFLEIIPTVH